LTYLLDLSEGGGVLDQKHSDLGTNVFLKIDILLLRSYFEISGGGGDTPPPEYLIEM